MQIKDLTKEVKDRLELIDWDGLKAQCGITREQIEINPFIASQLVYGQYTDLIPGEIKNLSGCFSLRAIPQDDGKPWIVKIYTMEQPKTKDDHLFLKGQEITSEKVKTGLIEKTDWYGRDGIRHYGYANANGCSPISIMVNGRKEQYLVSIHQPTNRVVGIKVDHVRNFFFDGNGDIRHRKFYGVELLPEQCEAFCEGKACRVDGCISGKFDKPFACYAQFDAAQRQLVECHPTWMTEAMKCGMDFGLEISRKREQEKPAQPAVVVIQI